MGPGALFSSFFACVFVVCCAKYFITPSGCYERNNIAQFLDSIFLHVNIFPSVFRWMKYEPKNINKVLNSDHVQLIGYLASNFKGDTCVDYLFGEQSRLLAKHLKNTSSSIIRWLLLGNYHLATSPANMDFQISLSLYKNPPNSQLVVWFSTLNLRSNSERLPFNFLILCPGNLSFVYLHIDPWELWIFYRSSHRYCPSLNHDTYG